MKRKIIIGLTIFSLFFLFGGTYIISTIETATSKLDNLITLHQVEIMREHLLIQLKKVQSDINLKNTPHARNIKTVMSNVLNMQQTVDVCFSCHHTEAVNEKIIHIKEDISDYVLATNRAFAHDADNVILRKAEDHAFKKGEHIINQVNRMITMTGMKLEDKTQASLNEITNTKRMLYLLVIIVPFFAAGLGFVFIRGLTEPVNVLLTGTRKLEGGDLEYRIEGLSSEFGELASSINNMSASLRGYMKNIEESEKRYRTLFESAGDGIFLIEAEGEEMGKIVSANRAAADMHHYDVNELLELNIIEDISMPEDTVNELDCFQRILKGEWVKDETMHRRKDGTLFPVEISAGLLQFMDKNYILVFDRDITERKRVEASLQRAEQMRVVGEWSAGLAHEIKNSLAGIKVSVEFLVDEINVSEEDRKFILKALDEIRRIQKLLKNLLNYAKPPKPSFIMTDINDILEKTLSLSMSSTSFVDYGNNIGIKKELGVDIPHTLADPMQLQQIFLNLVFNACEVMKDSGELSLRTEHLQNNNSIRIEISDTGSGIDDIMKEKIFEPFFTTKTKGTGLGLPITKQLIEQHGGTIACYSRPEQGTVFQIHIPVRQAEGGILQ